MTRALFLPGLTLGNTTPPPYRVTVLPYPVIANT